MMSGCKKIWLLIEQEHQIYEKSMNGPRIAITNKYNRRMNSNSHQVLNLIINPIIIKKTNPIKHSIWFYISNGVNKIKHRSLIS